MNINTAIYQLKRHPVTFLQNNLLSISGASNSGVTTYYFGYYDNNIPGVNESFKLQPGFAKSSLRVGNDGMKHKALQAHNVRMIKTSENVDISSIETYVLDGTGPDIMVTGQLSACIFTIRREGGRLLVAHIQPGGSALLSAVAMRQTLKLMGRFATGGNRVTHVFGMPDYSNRAHVVGIRTNGIWHLYGQRVVSGFGPIQGVTRII